MTPTHTDMGTHLSPHNINQAPTRPNVPALAINRAPGPQPTSTHNLLRITLIAALLLHAKKIDSIRARNILTHTEMHVLITTARSILRRLRIGTLLAGSAHNPALSPPGSLPALLKPMLWLILSLWGRNPVATMWPLQTLRRQMAARSRRRQRRRHHRPPRTRRRQAKECRQRRAPPSSARAWQQSALRAKRRRLRSRQRAIAAFRAKLRRSQHGKMPQKYTLTHELTARKRAGARRPRGHRWTFRLSVRQPDDRSIPSCRYTFPRADAPLAPDTRRGATGPTPASPAALDPAVGCGSAPGPFDPNAGREVWPAESLGLPPAFASRSRSRCTTTC